MAFSRGGRPQDHHAWELESKRGTSGREDAEKARIWMWRVACAARRKLERGENGRDWERRDPAARKIIALGVGRRGQ
jgi:hypothetical protein